MLAGGRSRRFGGAAKGLELVGGRRIIDRVADALRTVSDGLLLVANDPSAAAWLTGVPRVADARGRAGGLAGLEAALASGRDIIVVAWDMPFVPAELLDALIQEGQSTDADAVVPASDSPFGVEPYCAFYSARARAALSAFLDDGHRAAHEFIRLLPRTRVLDRAALPFPAHVLLSVNTPDDLARARAIAEAAE